MPNQLVSGCGFSGPSRQMLDAFGRLVSAPGNQPDCGSTRSALCFLELAALSPRVSRPATSTRCRRESVRRIQRSISPLRASPPPGRKTFLSGMQYQAPHGLSGRASRGRFHQTATAVRPALTTARRPWGRGQASLWPVKEHLMSLPTRANQTLSNYCLSTRATSTISFRIPNPSSLSFCGARPSTRSIGGAITENYFDMFDMRDL